MELIVVDIAFRGALTGFCLLLMFLIWVSRIDREAQIAFSVCVVAVLGRVWGNVPPPFTLVEPWLSGLRFLGAFGALGITWIMVTIFLDNKRLRWPWLLSSTLISLAVIFAPTFREFVPFLRGFAVLHFVALLLLIILSARGDLNNARRRIRPVLATVLLAFAISQSLLSTPMVGPRSMAHALMNSSVSTAVILLFALWALRADLNRWPGRVAPPPPEKPSVAEIDNARSALVERIQGAMDDGIWRQEGLTVSALAHQVEAPEHRVRKAINQRLGYRNFASFINSARIEAAKARLMAAEDQDCTVLEIAYSVGFGSLGPFNRAFREATGTSPTQFRVSAITVGDVSTN